MRIAQQQFFLQLAEYASKAFESQTRLAVHAGVYDLRKLDAAFMSGRSGAYNSEKYDAYKEPERFAKVNADYTLMSNLELGLNIFVHRDGNVKYFVTKG